jgi:uncharacterized protein YifE (UPF0438 family)
VYYPANQTIRPIELFARNNMNAKILHQRLLAKKGYELNVGPSSLLDASDIKLLEDYGYWLEGLISHRIPAITPEQRQFIRVAKKLGPATTHFERAWMNLLKARAEKARRSLVLKFNAIALNSTDLISDSFRIFFHENDMCVLGADRYLGLFVYSQPGAMTIFNPDIPGSIFFIRLGVAESEVRLIDAIPLESHFNDCTDAKSMEERIKNIIEVFKTKRYSNSEFQTKHHHRLLQKDLAKCTCDFCKSKQPTSNSHCEGYDSRLRSQVSNRNKWRFGSTWH